MSLKFTSRMMLNNLQEAKSRIAGRRASALITVPEEEAWWYYQEFGTASKMEAESTNEVPGIVQQDVLATPHPDGYDIHARNAQLIRLPVTSRFTEEWTAPYVHHPGVSPKAYIRRILPDIRNQSVPVVVRALIDGGLDLEVAQETLVGEVMPQVLDAITESMALHLNTAPDRDRGGKLDFQSPSTVFKDSALIIDNRAA